MTIASLRRSHEQRGPVANPVPHRRPEDRGRTDHREPEVFFKDLLQAIREGREAVESKEKCLEMSRSATEKVKSASEEEVRLYGI